MTPDIATYPHLKAFADASAAADADVAALTKAVATRQTQMVAARAGLGDRARAALLGDGAMPAYAETRDAVERLRRLLDDTAPIVETAQRAAADATKALADAVQDAPHREGRLRRERAAADPASPANIYGRVTGAFVRGKHELVFDGWNLGNPEQ